jgi:hypothetical protein
VQRNTDSLQSLTIGLGINSVELLNNYINEDGLPNDGYQRVVWETKAITRHFQGAAYHVSLYDSASFENDNFRRTFAYNNKNVCILFFSYTDEKALDQVKKTFYPEVKHAKPDALIYLVGIHGENEKVAQSDIDALAKQLGIRYFECQSLNGAELKNCYNAIFDHAAHRLYFQSRFTFFVDHFKKAKEGLQFAEQVAHVTRGLHQEGSPLHIFPMEVMLQILIEMGKPLLKDPDNQEDIKALLALCDLVISNADSAKKYSHKHMIWHREQDEFAIYGHDTPASERKRCGIM